jgi:hypothetical protein
MGIQEMTDKDRLPFSALLNALHSSFPNSKPPSDDTINLFFMGLADMTLDEVQNSAAAYVRTNKFFPTIADLHGVDNNNQSSIEYDYLHQIIEDFYWPELGEASRNIIEIKLKEAKKEHLIPMALRYGNEIAYSTNPTATRAQMIKLIESEAKTERNQLPGGKSIQIQGLNLMLDGIGKRE